MTDGLRSAPDRLGNEEREERARDGKQKLAYGMEFLDDHLRGIFPHDLVLIGAPSGIGKTEIALSIASHNASRGKRVTYLALEAEPRELERRIKFRLMARLAWDERNRQLRTGKHISGVPFLADLDYAMWRGNEHSAFVDGFDLEAEAMVNETLRTLSTFYRGKHFNAEDLAKVIREQADKTDLVVVDHLHYVDAMDSSDDNTAISETTKSLRTVALEVGKPVIAIAHLRKKDSRSAMLTPSIDDFHGSSNLTKIATQVVTIDRATWIEQPSTTVSPTAFSVVKDRRGGARRLVALTMFDLTRNTYLPGYTLGRAEAGKWKPLETSQLPHWARNHRAMA